jgi:hypothetical protein
VIEKNILQPKRLSDETQVSFPTEKAGSEALYLLQHNAMFSYLPKTGH